MRFGTTPFVGFGVLEMCIARSLSVVSLLEVTMDQLTNKRFGSEPGKFRGYHYGLARPSVRVG